MSAYKLKLNLFAVFYSSYRSKYLQTPFDSLFYIALSLAISYFWRKLQPWKVCLDLFLQKIYIGNARYLKILNSDTPLKSRQNLSKLTFGFGLVAKTKNNFHRDLPVTSNFIFPSISLEQKENNFTDQITEDFWYKSCRG